MRKPGTEVPGREQSLQNESRRDDTTALPTPNLQIPPTWYILPLAALHHAFDVWLTPDRKNSRYAESKEA